MLRYQYMHIFKYFIFMLLFSGVIFAEPSVKLGSIDAKVVKDGIEISGTVTGFGLKKPIPVYDQVTIRAELKNGPDSMYPKFGKYYSIAKSCVIGEHECLTKEENEGKNVTLKDIASLYLRKTPVWSAYGGLGEWEKNAPATVSKKFKGVIGKKFCGKRVRIHAILKYVIGGPYANWPGIYFYHDTAMMQMPDCQEGNTDTSNNDSDEGKNDDNTNNFNATYHVSAQKEGYIKDWNDREINIESIKTLIVWGTVYDNQNKPLPFTKVTLAILGETFTTQSDSNGDFRFEITINPDGNKVVEFNEDLHLKKPVSHISAEILSNKLAANGKEQRVRVKFTDKNGAVANKRLYISSDNMPLMHNGSIASYAKFAYDSKYITTDGNGVAEFTVHSPKVPVNLVNKYDDNKLFPISSSYHIYALDNGEKERVGSMKIDFYSPKPHIAKMIFPSGVEEGFWQSIPSKVSIDDLDSNHFRIEVMGYGRFKSQGSGVRYNKLIRQFEGKIFEFYFQPQKIGFDLNDQPDLWKQLLIVNLKALGSAFIPLAQNGKLPFIPTGSKGFKAMVDYLVVAAGAKDYYNLVQQTYDTPDYKNVMDGAVGGALLGDALANIILKKDIPVPKLMQLELLKAIYANASEIYGAYKQYKAVENAYKDVMPFMIVVSVSDDDGYKSVAHRVVMVKVWREVK